MKKVILDVDTGIDDALAIAYAVHSPELEVLGITTCFGNVSVEEATRNTIKLLEILGRTDIPVIPGAEKPLFRSHLKGKASFIHGEDGLGNSDLPLPRQTALNKPATEFISTMVRNFPNEVTLVPVGPLTNIALTIMQDSEITSLLKEVVLMGGAVLAPGNTTPLAEANVYADPEAAEYVFRSGAPLTLVGLDVTMKTLLSRQEVESWKNINTDLSRLFVKAVSFYIDAYQSFYPDINGCALHDPLAVGVVIDPSFVKKVPMYVQVDTEGELSMGRTIPDLRKNPIYPPNINVCLEVDAERFAAHFKSRVLGYKIGV